jgi:hypothetical protein
MFQLFWSCIAAIEVQNLENVIRETLDRIREREQAERASAATRTYGGALPFPSG